MKNYCKDCGKEICSASLHCRSCAPRHPGERIVRYCIDCGAECQGKRCWDCHCAHKIESARTSKESRLSGEEGTDFVVCPLCNEKLIRITWKHAWFKHNLKWEEFKKLHPNTQRICNASSNKTSETLYERWDDDAKAAYSTLMSEYWQEGGRFRSKEWAEAHINGVMRRVARQREEGMYDPGSPWIKNLSKHAIRQWKEGIHSWTDKRKETLSKTKKRQWKEGVYDHVFNTPSNLECKFAEKLDDEEITYEQQYRIGSYLVDFLVENTLVVELNGDYWHNLPGARDRDKERNKWIEQQGFPVLVVWESEFYNDPKACIEKVKGNLS